MEKGCVSGVEVRVTLQEAQFRACPSWLYVVEEEREEISLEFSGEDDSVTAFIPALED